jgi:hypothetical protein
MQFFINMTKADQVIRTAPAINATVLAFKQDEVRVELFDYGTAMGWGYDVRTRVFLNGVALPFGAEQIHQRKRPDWLPVTITISDWNRIVKSAIQKTPL